MNILSKIIATSALTAMAMTAHAGALAGTKWNTAGNKAVVQFSESGGVVSGRIIRVTDRSKANDVCDKCPGNLRGQKIEGLRIITGLRAKGNNVWDGGKLIDPNNGKTYSGKVTLNGNRLTLRGYVGISALGRSETWTRAN